MADEVSGWRAALQRRPWKMALFALRLLFGVSLLAWLLTSQQDAVKGLAGRVSWGWFALAVVARFGWSWLNAHKWRVITAHLAPGRAPTTLRSWEYYLQGLFASLFLPTSVGGDVLRAIKMGRHVDTSNAVSGVLLDRVYSLLALAAFVPPSVLLISPERRPAWLLPAALASTVALVGLVVLTHADGRIAHLGRSGARAAWVLRSLRDSRYAPQGLGLGILSTLLVVLSYWFCALALGSATRFEILLSAVPLIALARLLPVSVNGIGVGEAVTAALLATPDAVLLSLLAFFAATLCAMAGGILWILR